MSGRQASGPRRPTVGGALIVHVQGLEEEDAIEGPSGAKARSAARALILADKRGERRSRLRLAKRGKANCSIGRQLSNACSRRACVEESLEVTVVTRVIRCRLHGYRWQRAA